LGQSLYVREILKIEGHDAGAPPSVDLTRELNHAIVIRSLIEKGLISSCHDISDGGFLVALAEMCMGSHIGCSLNAEISQHDFAHFWFGEDQARYLVATSNKDAVLDLCRTHNIEILHCGKTGGSNLEISQSHMISVADLVETHEQWLPSYMAGQI
jgi:phosphoribosylformylglycinamidine synthase